MVAKHAHQNSDIPHCFYHYQHKHTNTNMTNPFDWYHSLYYGEKWSIKEFDTKTPTSLDYLLKQMFKKAYCTGDIKMKNSLPAFNAAYYIACCIANTEGVDETSFGDEMDDAIKLIWKEDYKRNHRGKDMICPLLELMLVKWMAFAVLFLQEKKSDEMNAFLEMFENGLIETGDDMLENEKWSNCGFLDGFCQMIRQWEHTYNTDLRPNALHPRYYTDGIWNSYVRHYSMTDIKWQLTFFRTQQEQKAFLDWARQMSARPQPLDPDELPF